MVVPLTMPMTSVRWLAARLWRRGPTLSLIHIYLVRQGDMDAALTEIGGLAVTREVKTVLRVEGIDA